MVWLMILTFKPTKHTTITPSIEPDALIDINSFSSILSSYGKFVNDIDENIINN